MGWTTGRRGVEGRDLMASVDGKDADLPGGGRTLADRVRTPFSVREIVLRSIALPPQGGHHGYEALQVRDDEVRRSEFCPGLALRYARR